jgi:uncharacterized lipoprotein
VAYSLSRGHFTTADQDQSAGLFYVNHTLEPEPDPDMWFRGWFGRGVRNLDVNYSIKLIRSDDGIQVRVLDKDGGGVDRTEAIRLLRDLRANLS